MLAELQRECIGTSRKKRKRNSEAGNKGVVNGKQNVTSCLGSNAPKGCTLNSLLQGH